MTGPYRELNAHDIERIAGKLRILRRLPGVTGILVATTDGRGVVGDLKETTPGSAAAVTASSIGLASRLADLSERGATVLELQLRSEAGYVCLYAINDGHLLTVVTSHTVNLARLKLEVRDILIALNGYLAEPPRTTPFPTPPMHRN